MSEEQRPTPGANPARRARRIGGRPSPSGSTSSSAAPSTTPADTAVRLDKADQPRETVRDQPATGPVTDRARTVRSLPLAWFPAAVLGTAAVLLLGILVWFSHGGYWGKPPANSVSNPDAKQQQQVLAAAKQCFATLNSYDYRKLDSALAAGLKCTTGKFTSDYENVFHQQVEKYGPTVKIVRVAQVNKAGVEAIGADGKQWTVLIYGQLQITSASTQKSGSPQISPVGGVVTMDDVNGKWLVSKVDTDTGNGLGG